MFIEIDSLFHASGYQLRVCFLPWRVGDLSMPNHTRDGTTMDYQKVNCCYLLYQCYSSAESVTFDF
jgi:hypothetical protein